MSNNEEDRAEKKRAKERAQRLAKEEEDLKLLLSNKPLPKGSVRVFQMPNRRSPWPTPKNNASRRENRQPVELFSGPDGPKLRISRQRDPKLRLASNEYPKQIGCLQGLCMNNSKQVNRRINEMSGRLGKVDDKLNETLAMFRALMPVVQETRDAAVGVQENIAEVAAKMDTGFGKIGKLFKREHAKITNPFHYIYLYYYTLYTLLRLACESLIVGSKPFREYTLALPCGLSLLVILVYVVMFLLFIFVYEIGIFFGSFGVLHYYGRQHDVFAIVVATSIKLVGSVCLTLWDLKGFFTPYGKIMKNAFMDGFKLDDMSLKDSVSEGASAVSGYVQNKTSSAVSHIVNQSVSAAVDRIPTMTNISSAVAAGIASHAIGAKDAIASGVVDLGSAVASGASDLGSATYSGVSAAAGKASELGTAIADSGAGAVKATTQAAKDAASATAQVAKDAASATAQATRDAAAAAAKRATNWFKGKKDPEPDTEPHGGGLNVLDRFKEFDDIHILQGKQLDMFNKSKIGVMLETLKSKMDGIIVNNVERNMGNPINQKALYAMNCTMNLILDKGLPLLINELYTSVPLCEYIKTHKVVLNQNYNENLFNGLCNFDIVSFYYQNKISKHIKSTSHKSIKHKHVPHRYARLTQRQSMP